MLWEQKVVLMYFNPRSPCGERQLTISTMIEQTAISIHALRAESDIEYAILNLCAAISIHALRAESDIFLAKLR